MEVRRFDQKLDLPAYYKWLYLHNCEIHDISELPEVGFIAYHNEFTPVAAAFLRKVEGGFGQLDGLTSNPECPSEMRHNALDAVVNQLLEYAKSININKIMAFSVDASTLLRSERHGFKKFPYTVIAVNLNDKG